MTNAVNLFEPFDSARAMSCFALYQGNGTASFGDGYSFFMMFLQTILALGFVCGLAYVMFRVVLPRLNAGRMSGHLVRVVDRVPIEARKSLYVIEVAGRFLLISSSEAGVHIVSELDKAATEEAVERIERERPTFKPINAVARSQFADHLARLMNKKR